MNTMPTLPATSGVQTWLDGLDTWGKLMQGALRSFSQPILPGWTFNIDSNNSSSPQTEADVFAQFSYGKQLGRINDALARLIEEREGDDDVAAFDAFMEMTRKIDDAKRKGAKKRVEQIVADLKFLELSDQAEYRRAAAALRAEIAKT